MLRILSLFLSLLLVFQSTSLWAAGTSEGNPSGDPGSKPNSEGSASALDKSFQTDLFSGSSSHSVPLIIAPGKEVSPTLSLNYSSDGREKTWIGHDWNLSIGGLILRSGPGHKVSSFDSNDVFSLRGSGVSSDLFLKTGSSTEYLTVRESFSKIIKDESGNCWKVKTPDGTETEYGCTTNSRIFKIGSSSGFSNVAVWAANKVTNANGYSMNLYYAYDSTGGDYYPDRIEYSFGPSSLDTGAVVEFVLEDRCPGVSSDQCADVMVSYATGSKVTMDKRIKWVRSWMDRAKTKLFAAYEFVYGTNNIVAGATNWYPLSGRLVEVRQYGNQKNSDWNTSSAHYLQSWRFEYTQRLASAKDGGWSPTSVDATLGNHKFVRVAGSPWLPRERGVLISDVNGDGRNDVIRSYSNSQGVVTKEGKVFDGSTSSYVSSTFNNPPLFVYAQSDGKSRSRAATFVDINGDGRIDVVIMKRAIGQLGGFCFAAYEVYLNDGTNWVAANSNGSAGSLGYQAWQWQQSIQNLPATPYLTKEWFLNDLCEDTSGEVPGTATFANVNGDQFPDLLWFNDTTGARYIGLNNGDTTFTVISNAQFPYAPQADNVKLVDINGDQLTDFVRSHNDDGNCTSNVWLNMGNLNWEQNTPLSDTLRTQCITHVFSHAPNGNYQEHRQDIEYLDINGDELPDAITNCWVFINNGNGGFTNVCPTQTPASTLGRACPDENFTLHNDRTGTACVPRSIWPWNRVYDWDGDGLEDYVAGYFDGNNNEAATDIVQKASGGYPGLLSKVTFPTGGTVEFGYTSSTAFDNTDPVTNRPTMPVNKQVVTSITADDGRGHRYTNNYTYKGGKYDALAGEFRGFRETHQILANGTRTISKFFQDDQKKGLTEIVEERDAQDHVLSQTTLVYDSDVDGLKPYFTPILSRTTTDSSYSSAGTMLTQKTTKEWRYRSDYDSYGNLLRTVLEGDTSVTGDERTIFNEFVPNTTKWILRTAGRQGKLYSGIVASPGSGFKAYQEIIFRGNTTPSEAPQNLYVKKASTVGGDQTVSTTENVTFDNYGNPTVSKDLRGNLTTAYFDSESSHPAGVVPTRVVNAAGHVTQTHYDNYLRPYQTVSPNNVVTTTTFDEFHRPTQVASSSSLETITYNNIGNPQTQFIRNEVKKSNSLTLFTEEYIDGLGRTYKSITKGVDANHDVIITTEYDSMGRPFRIYLPVFRSEYVEGGVNHGYLETEYDVSDRVVRITKSDGNYVAKEYNGWVTTVTNEKGMKKEIETDAYKNVVRVTDKTSEGDFTTKFSYDVANNLIEAKDHFCYDGDAATPCNTVSMIWDDLGRKKTMTDPNMGTWTYTYDSVGNLKDQVDGKGCWLHFEYDSLNRIVQKTDWGTPPPNAQSCNNFNYIMTYDESEVAEIPPVECPENPGGIGGGGFIIIEDCEPFPGQPGYTRGKAIGKLVKEAGQEYYREFFYDDASGLGRLSKKTEIILGSMKVDEFTYNLDGSLLSNSVVVDGVPQLSVNYTYDASGSLASINRTRGGVTKTILASTARNANGQITQRTLGNNTVTQMQYYDAPIESHALKLLKTLDSSNRAIQQYEYTYDPSGNLIQIVDTKPDANFNYSTETRLYGYDDLNRLKSAGVADNPIRYVYDPVGNLRKLEYGPAGYLPFGRSPTADPY